MVTLHFLNMQKVVHIDLVEFYVNGFTLDVWTALEPKKERYVKLKNTAENTDVLINNNVGNSESQSLKSEYVIILCIAKDRM